MTTPDSSAKQCHVCGAAVDVNCGDGRCPACLFKEAFMVNGSGSQSIGSHELVDEIARGGMGVVYRAVQREPLREVALKTLLVAGMRPDEACVRFEQEARAMAELEHSGILPIYQFGREEGVPWFTMKLATGGTLAQRLNQYRGQWRSIASVVAGVAEAVQFAHGRGVLHRDLKPANILFDENDHAYVGDFGLAKLAETGDGGMTISAAMMGTPHYMAPEVVESGARAASTASDVWSLGVVLYELLVQRRPFAADSVPALLREISDRDPAVPPREVPRGLAAISLKALARDPHRRYGSARELAQDLHCWMEGRPVNARVAGTLERLVLWARRRPAVAALSALLTGTLTVGLAITAWQYLEQKKATGRALTAEGRQKELREQAEAAAKKSTVVAEFLKEMVSAPMPENAMGMDTALMRAYLERIAARLPQDLAGQPDSKADLMNSIGWAWIRMGDPQRAHQMMRDAVRLLKSMPSPDPLQLATALQSLAKCTWYIDGSQLEANACLHEAVEWSRRSLPPGHPTTAGYLISLGISLKHLGEFAAAVEVLREASTSIVNAAGRESNAAREGYRELALGLEAAGRLDEAITAQLSACEIDSKLGMEDGDAAADSSHLGRMLSDKGQLDEARPWLEKALAGCRKSYGESDHFTRTVIRNLALLHLRRNDAGAAAALADETRERLKTTGPDGRGHRRSLLQLLANIYRKTERWESEQEILWLIVDNLEAETDFTAGSAYRKALDDLRASAEQLGNREMFLQQVEDRITKVLKNGNHRDAGLRLCEMGEGLRRSGSHDLAAKAYEAARSCLANSPVANVASLSKLLLGLAYVQRQRRLPVEAESEFQQLLRTVLKESTGTDSNTVLLPALTKLSAVLREHSRWPDAESVLRRRLVLDVAASPQARDALYVELARVQTSDTRRGAADQTRKLLLDHWRRAATSDPRLLCAPLRHYAGYLQSRGRAGEAATALRESLDIICRHASGEAGPMDERAALAHAFLSLAWSIRTSDTALTAALAADVESLLRTMAADPAVAGANSTQQIAGCQLGLALALRASTQSSLPSGEWNGHFAQAAATVELNATPLMMESVAPANRMEAYQSLSRLYELWKTALPDDRVEGLARESAARESTFRKRVADQYKFATGSVVNASSLP